jgi:hypothetical protein
MHTYEFQDLKVGARVQVKTTSGEWVEATVARLASSINRMVPFRGGRYQGHQVLLASGQKLSDVKADSVRWCLDDMNKQQAMALKFGDKVQVKTTLGNWVEAKVIDKPVTRSGLVYVPVLPTDRRRRRSDVISENIRIQPAEEKQS